MVLDITVGLVVLFLMVLGFIRGFIKEAFGIAGLVAAVGATVVYRDYFFDIYSARVQSDTLAGFFSGITVFVGAMTSAILVNSVIMRILSSLRHGVLDKTAGAVVGFAKGLVISYFIFFAVETFLYVFAPQPKDGDESTVAELPSWFVDTYSYGVFSVTSWYMGSSISDETYDKISIVVHELIDKKRIGRAMIKHGHADED
ncbi:MAG: CvpA family protein [Aaplasma endosymbiont of Hyalomma asiaticum]